MNSQKTDDELEFLIKENSHALVPEGKYEVMYAKHEIRPFFNSRKLYLICEIINSGTHSGTKLFRAYNYPERLTRGCDLFKELEMIYGNRLRKNTNLSIKLFKGKVLLVRVRTVKKNRKQDTLLPHQHYSVIDSFIQVLAGS